MGYEKIDTILNLWATKHNLPMYTIYKEIEVRSFQIVNSDGQQFQIWIDLPDEESRIGVHVWDYKKRREDYLVEQTEVFDTLEIAYQIASLWSRKK